MIALFLSILLNAYLGIIFAWFHRKGIDIFQAIVFNYGVCVLSGLTMIGPSLTRINISEKTYLPWAILLGSLFISVFNLVGYSSTQVGITVTQTANKLSLVIPVLMAVYLYQEPLSALKIFGILLALLAVILISFKPGKTLNTSNSGLRWVIPLLLFVSSGLIDTLTKYVERRFLQAEMDANLFLVISFGTAFFIGMLLLMVQLYHGKRTFSIRNLWGGIILGIPNYFSIYFLVMALKSQVLQSSALIPINNIGVLLLVTLVGLFGFHEKLSRVNVAGILITLLAILLIALGDS